MEGNEELHGVYEFIAIYNSLLAIFFFLYDSWQIWPDDLEHV